jgi:hypothetical protein
MTIVISVLQVRTVEHGAQLSNVAVLVGEAALAFIASMTDAATENGNSTTPSTVVALILYTRAPLVAATSLTVGVGLIPSR